MKPLSESCTEYRSGLPGNASIDRNNGGPSRSSSNGTTLEVAACWATAETSHRPGNVRLVPEPTQVPAGPARSASVDGAAPGSSSGTKRRLDPLASYGPPVARVEVQLEPVRPGVGPLRVEPGLHGAGGVGAADGQTERLGLDRR